MHNQVVWSAILSDMWTVQAIYPVANAVVSVELLAASGAFALWPWPVGTWRTRLAVAGPWAALFRVYLIEVCDGNDGCKFKCEIFNLIFTRGLLQAVTCHPLKKNKKTYQLFKLGSPNLDQRCKRPWLKSILFYGAINLGLQGQI